MDKEKLDSDTILENSQTATVAAGNNVETRLSAIVQRSRTNANGLVISEETAVTTANMPHNSSLNTARSALTSSRRVSSLSTARSSQHRSTSPARSLPDFSDTSAGSGPNSLNTAGSPFSPYETTRAGHPNYGEGNRSGSRVAEKSGTNSQHTAGSHRSAVSFEPNMGSALRNDIENSGRSISPRTAHSSTPVRTARSLTPAPRTRHNDVSSKDVVTAFSIPTTPRGTQNDVSSKDVATAFSIPTTPRRTQALNSTRSGGESRSRTSISTERFISPYEVSARSCIMRPSQHQSNIPMELFQMTNEGSQSISPNSPNPALSKMDTARQNSYKLSASPASLSTTTARPITTTPQRRRTSLNTANSSASLSSRTARLIPTTPEGQISSLNAANSPPSLSSRTARSIPTTPKNNVDGYSALPATRGSNTLIPTARTARAIDADSGSTWDENGVVITSESVDGSRKVKISVSMRVSGGGTREVKGYRPVGMVTEKVAVNGNNVYGN